MKNKAKKLTNFIKTNYWKLMLLGYTLFAPVNVAYATDADAMWNNFIDFIMPWVQRAGGVTAFIGIILFGYGWKEDDANSKTRGTNCIIAGCIIFAAGFAGKAFLS